MTYRVNPASLLPRRSQYSAGAGMALAGIATILALAACGKAPESGAGAMFGGPAPVSVLSAQAETLPAILQYTAQTLGSSQFDPQPK